MVSDAPLVLVSRPAVQASEFRQMLGSSVLCISSPILEIEFLQLKFDPDNFGGFIFASRNGVLAASRNFDLKGHRAFAVGRRTAQLASEFGMAVTHSNGGSNELVQHVAQANPEKKLMLVRGENSVGHVVENLASFGVAADQVVGYLQVPRQLSDEAKKALQGPKGILVPVFSPRSAQLLGIEFNKSGVFAPITLIGMSEKIIASWCGPVPAVTHVAKRPTLAEMVKDILHYVDACT